MNPPNPQIHNSPDNRIFRSDARLSPEEIQNLLGLRVTIERQAEMQNNSNSCRNTECSRMLTFAILTLILASGAMLGSMYQMKIGPFHESSDIFAAAKSR